MRAFLLIGALALSIIQAFGEGDLPGLLDEAKHFEQSGEMESAIRTYKKILAVDSRDYKTINAIAGIYGKLGRFQEEIRWAGKAKGIKTDFVAAWINFGNGQLAMGNFKEARQTFESAMAIAPKDPLPTYSLGIVEEQEQNFERALVLYRKSTELDPNFENGYYNTAAMYANLNNPTEARNVLQKILQKNPHAADAKKMMGRLEAQILAQKK